jgi:hypothetical protein
MRLSIVTLVATLTLTGAASAQPGPGSRIQQRIINDLSLKIALINQQAQQMLRAGRYRNAFAVRQWQNQMLAEVRNQAGVDLRLLQTVVPRTAPVRQTAGAPTPPPRPRRDNRTLQQRVDDYKYWMDTFVTPNIPFMFGNAFGP